MDLNDIDNKNIDTNNIINENNRNISCNKKSEIDSFQNDLQIFLNSTNFSIDRFEGDFAVCENKVTHEMTNIKKDLLPENCKEGDIIKLKNGKYIIDEKQTQIEQEEIKKLAQSLFKNKNN